jgi:hypothetical protein
MEQRHFVITTVFAIVTGFLFTAPELCAQSHTKGRPVAASAADLKPGDCVVTAGVGKKPPNLKDLASRISIDPSFLQDVRSLVTPGTTLVLTNAPVSSQTHSGPGFNILTTDVR